MRGLLVSWQLTVGWKWENKYLGKDENVYFEIEDTVSSSCNTYCRNVISFIKQNNSDVNNLQHFSVTYYERADHGYIYR